MYAVDLYVAAALSYAAVPSLAFSSIDLREVTMHPDEEHVEVRRQVRKRIAPGAEFYDVLDEQIVARTGQGGQASVKALEEAWPHLVPPGEGTPKWFRVAVTAERERSGY
ncbi:MAG TPA: hypothetical protein VM347_17595 [Nonomuraea sp.]|nr:hypothetical protein [Nonomuraea sp.]